MSLTISKYKVEYPILALSPMDAVTDYSYREITKRYGDPDLIFTEFINVNGLSLGIDKLIEELRYSENQRPIISQIYGTEPEMFYRAALICLYLGFDGIDINMGCPSKNVSSRGAGAGLIKTPDLALEIVSAVKRAIDEYKENREICNKLLGAKIIGFLDKKLDLWRINKDNVISLERVSNITLSVKTRIGVEEVTIESWVDNLNKAPLNFLSIHGRTLKQMYTGFSNLEALRRGVEISRFPTLVNGDINSIEKYNEVMEVTKAKGVLIGRASMGNPFIFKQLRKEIVDINEDLNKQMLKDYSKEFVDSKGEARIYEMRKIFINASKGRANAGEYRLRASKVSSFNEAIEFIDTL